MAGQARAAGTSPSRLTAASSVDTPCTRLPDLVERALLNRVSAALGLRAPPPKLGRELAMNTIRFNTTISAVIGTLGSTLFGCALQTGDPADRAVSTREPLVAPPRSAATAAPVSTGGRSAIAIDPAAAPIPMYDVVQIGPLSDGASLEEATAINNNGVVTGTSVGAFTLAFTFANCELAVVPSLPGLTTISMMASDINDSGTVVGTAFVTDSHGTFMSRPFKSTGGVTTQLDGTTNFEDAIAVGPADIALGSESTVESTTSVYYLLGQAFALAPFVLRSGRFWLLVPVVANGMNRYFHVVGQASNFGVVSGGGFTGWSRITGVGTETALDPRSINDNGHIAGTITVGTSQHGFWSTDPATSARDLGVLPGGSQTFAQSINNGDDIVGDGTTATGDLHAVIWRNGVITDLNTRLFDPGSAWVLTQANDINDSGWIVGAGTNNGLHRAFLLVPRTPLGPCPSVNQ
jgi:probable HAF family extracellular repeat protein